VRKVAFGERAVGGARWSIRAERFVAAFVLVIVAVWGAGAASAASESGLARLLARRDPGARLGASTVVVTGSAATVEGVPDRPNFVLALGSHETVVGGAKDDEIGALGDHDTIVAGKAGHELIVGGPDGKVDVTGSGHDVVIDTKNNATVMVDSPSDEIVVEGKKDAVICKRHIRDVIFARKGDSVSKSCRADHDPIRPISSSSPVAHTAAATVEGDGSEGNPYVAPCDNSTEVDCQVRGFAVERLRGLWANEYVPAYRCPPDHPYLLNQNYVQAGTTLPNGVQLQSLSPIGVAITETSTTPNENLATGTATGRLRSSATNWALGASSYHILLHCTSDVGHGWRS
jgi:hypothetical protein